MAEHEFAVDLLDIDSLEPNPRNANQGDVGAIATAIAVDGWHGTVIAQDRGDDAPLIVIGEHRWRALSMLQRDGIELNDEHHTYDELLADKTLMLPPIGKVPGQVLKMDDTRAIRKMLADNRASALSLTDDQLLVDLLADLAEAEALLGSLYDGDELDDLINFVAPPPSLEELASSYGAPQISDNWPVLRFKISPDLKARYEALTEGVEGEADSPEKFEYLLDCAEGDTQE